MQRVHMESWANTVLGDPVAASFVSGIGVHWCVVIIGARNDWCPNAHPSKPLADGSALSKCASPSPWGCYTFYFAQSVTRRSPSPAHPGTYNSAPGTLYPWSTALRYAAIEDKLDVFGLLSATHEKFPEPFILGTEACEGFLPWSQGVYPGDWPRAETYAHDVIGDVNNWAGGWTDWNILLDMKGGPNWAGNVVDAPVIADTAGGQAVYKQPMFYYLGHITKFVPPGSVRIGFQSSGVPVLSAPMECATFLTPDNKVVVVVLNRDISDHEFAVHYPGKGYINAHIPQRAMQTYIFDAAKDTAV
jgi:O-glycosyl hydrolase